MRILSTHLSVRPGKGWFVQWSVDGFDPGHSITIERSASPEGPWQIIESNIDPSTVSFEDWSITNFNGLFTEIYYRIKYLDGVGGDVAVSKPINRLGHTDRYSAELIRIQNLELYGVNGNPGVYSRAFACFKPFKHGTPCTTCTSPTGERGQIINCPACHNTGYLEKWSTPILFRARWFSGQRKTRNVETIGKMDRMQRFMKTSSYPLIEPKDILVEKGNDRIWKVSDIEQGTMNEILTSQTITVELFDPSKDLGGYLVYPE